MTWESREQEAIKELPQNKETEIFSQRIHRLRGFQCEPKKQPLFNSTLQLSGYLFYAGTSVAD